MQTQGFGFRILARAGLATADQDGHPTDRFRDQMMLLTRGTRCWIRCGLSGFGPALPPLYSTSGNTVVRRPSNVLAGVAEQLDLLRDGRAIPVVDKRSHRMRSRSRRSVGILPVVGLGSDVWIVIVDGADQDFVSPGSATRWWLRWSGTMRGGVSR
jgi:hypothetical protein